MSTEHPEADAPGTGEAPWSSNLLAMADLVTPMALRVAATLRLADHLAEGVTSIDALAERTGADRRALSRVVKHLAALNVFHEEAADEYRLTPLGEQLRSGGSGCVQSWLDINGAIGRADLAIAHLLDTVRSGEPAYPRVYGSQFWDDMERDPALSATFDEQMGSGAAVKAPALAAGYPWESVRHVADVGGGNGTLLIGLLTAHPHLTGTLIDRPGPAAAGADAFAAAGIADRCRAVPQSFFDPLPTGADVYVISGVLHDWDDERATEILRRAAQGAASGGGRVVVVEALIEQTGRATPATVMDLRMLVFLTGRGRSADELAQLAKAAGLSMTTRYELMRHHSLIEFAVDA